MRPMRPNALAVAAVAVLVITAIILLATRGYNPNAIGNMPGPVQQVLNTATLSGNNIGVNILDVTGNQAYIGRGSIPGDYSYGPVENQGDNIYYVDLNVPIDMQGIEKQLGYKPQVSTSAVSSDATTNSTTLSYEDYINIVPLPNQAFDRLYYDPNTHMAVFSFKLNPNGTVMDESWDAVAVNS